jgi:acyl-ACP thioesterase
MEYLKEKGIAWVLNAWQIEINRLPRLSEYVTIGTVPYMLRGPLGLRNFFMDTNDGERLAVANSIWTLFDFNKGVPCKVTPEIVDAYPLGDKLPMKYRDRKIAIPTDGERYAAPDIEVMEHHLDTNNHVNNGQYIRMAIGLLHEKDAKVISLRAEYKKQAFLSDILHPIVIVNNLGDNKIYTVSLNDDEGGAVCVVEIETDCSHTER